MDIKAVVNSLANWSRDLKEPTGSVGGSLVIS